MSDRKPGWYWVKIREAGLASDWFPTRWEGEDWSINNRSDSHSFKLIAGPRIPTPDEPWQTVPVEPTKSMREEFREAHEAWEEGKGDGSGSPDFQWKAMLAAAPKP
ncbi:hypothetical protein [Halomonas elongata]|uniref:hypothetical protein n=1 Tax=Halomonas elongata TaxID=2746 RepID=UPI00186B8FB1|nr:hypothetical protein [Halomonas elongata]MBW5800635.1 hypothetical protein [Halomonas elongata]